jgi:23S rRNA U2552 (ribose-2'-O)-methylase RlmE/FtsJ
MGCLFDSVLVTKPSPSKPGNSETYIIGKGKAFPRERAFQK